MLWSRLCLICVLVLLHPAPAFPSDAESALPGPGLTWPGGVFRWRYNPEYAPAWLAAGEASTLVQEAAKKWEACGIHMQYLGETHLRPGAMDGENVVGWAPVLPGGIRGVTKGRARGRQLVERDISYDSTRREFKEYPRLLEKVLVHEFGHAIGLTHSPVCGDVMTLAADCPRTPASNLPIVPTANDLSRCRSNYADVLRQ